jgi:hypothetical protein
VSTKAIPQGTRTHTEDIFFVAACRCWLCLWYGSRNSRDKNEGGYTQSLKRDVFAFRFLFFLLLVFGSECFPIPIASQLTWRSEGLWGSGSWCRGSLVVMYFWKVWWYGTTLTLINVT